MSDPTAVQTPDKIFWEGSFGARGFEAVLEAAADGGFELLAIGPLVAERLFAAGRSAAEVREMAAARGIRLAELDGVSSWAPVWSPREAPPAIQERFDISVERNLEIAVDLGLDSILAAGAFDRGAVADEVLVEGFADLCDRAAAHGIRVELEFVPFWGIPDLGSAWRIVSEAGRANAGLMIDTWHLLKGSQRPAEAIELLGEIPAEKLANVQLADALLAPQADSLYGEGRFRRFPGDGELAIDEVVRIIDGRGGLRRIGVEIFGAAIDDLSPQEAGLRSARTADETLERARSSTGEVES